MGVMDKILLQLLALPWWILIIRTTKSTKIINKDLHCGLMKPLAMFFDLSSGLAAPFMSAVLVARGTRAGVIVLPLTGVWAAGSWMNLRLESKYMNSYDQQKPGFTADKLRPHYLNSKLILKISTIFQVKIFKLLIHWIKTWKRCSSSTKILSNNAPE